MEKNVLWVKEHLLILTSREYFFKFLRVNTCSTDSHDPFLLLTRRLSFLSPLNELAFRIYLRSIWDDFVCLLYFVYRSSNFAAVLQSSCAFLFRFLLYFNALLTKFIPYATYCTAAHEISFNNIFVHLKLSSGKTLWLKLFSILALKFRGATFLGSANNSVVI